MKMSDLLDVVGVVVASGSVPFIEGHAGIVKSSLA
ncbi:hypothetical protein FPHOBKDP_00015 [Listeria phage LPJP1]|nr:hypothetical protein FPHOBKDP_00015 [Listeria phage LPJP1]